MLLNKLMYALHKALGNEKVEAVQGMPIVSSGSDIVGPDPSTIAAQAALSAARQLDFQRELQRRTGEGGKMYWRCYFNAVSCF